MIIIAAITILLLLVEHWFPWQLLMGKPLHRVAAYILGVLALLVPLSAHWWIQGDQEQVIQLWVIVLAGGLAVIIAYVGDHIMRRLAQARDLEELEKQRDEHQSANRLQG